MMIEKTPLVTVGIATYNSSNFIIETLESIYLQTYPNIELIVSDDASSDDTMIKVKSWLDEKDRRKRFVDVKILEVEKNTGISANANRKLKVSSGEWIKPIGHDDTLLPNCVSDNIKFVYENPDVKVLFSKLNIYKDTFEEENLIVTTPSNITDKSIIWHKRSAASQYQMLLLSDRIHFTPSIFINRKTLESIGGYDDDDKLLEDYPLWLNLTKAGYKLYFMDKITVNYRRHAKAINNTGKKNIINPNYFKLEDFRKRYTYPYLPVDVRLHQRYNWFVSQVFRIKQLNMDNKLNRLLHSLLIIYLNPFRYYFGIKNKIVNRKGYSDLD